MSRIMAALKADDDVGLLGEPVDDLAFAFVAPLRTNHDHIGHEVSFLRAAEVRIVSKLQRLTPKAALYQIKDASRPGKSPGARREMHQRQPMPVSNSPLPILASPPLTTPDDFALCKADPRQNCGNNGSPDERRAGDVIGSRLGAWRAAISGGTPACR